MSFAPSFDPYREWLGIEPHEQPADFYRLLGVARFEPEAGRIAAAADQRMALVRSFQMGPRGDYTQRLLNELAAARVTLLTPQSRAAYDAALAQHQSPAAAAARAAFAPHFAQHPAIEEPPVLPPAVPPPIAAPRSPVNPIAAKPEAPNEELIEEEPRRAWWPVALMLGIPALLLGGVIAWGLLGPGKLGAKGTPSDIAADDGSQTKAVEPQPKPAPKAIVILQEGSGEVLLTPATATLSGEVELAVSGTEEVLIGWNGAETAAEWRFRIVKPGIFDAEATYASSDAAAGKDLELLVGEMPRSIALRDSGGVDRFTTDTVKLFVTTSGESTLIVRPAQPAEGDWLVLKSVRLVPVKRDVTPADTP
jgi:hypothetical protein